MIKTIKLNFAKKRNRVQNVDYLEQNFIVLTDQRVSVGNRLVTDSYLWNILDVNSFEYSSWEDGNYDAMHIHFGFNSEGADAKFQSIKRKITGSVPTVSVTDVIGTKMTTQYFRIELSDLGVVILSYQSGKQMSVFLNKGDAPSCGRKAHLWSQEKNFDDLITDTSIPQNRINRNPTKP